MARERGENGIKQLEDGIWQVRVTYTESSGKRRVFKRQAETITDAKRLRKLFLKELENTGENVLDGDRITFGKLAAIYREKKVIPAQYVNGRKVAGLRSHKTLLGKLNQLDSHFNNKRIKTFTVSDVEAYKAERLKTPVVMEIKTRKVSFDEKGKKVITVEKNSRSSQRAISSVNRELELLRAMFRFAVREGWLNRSPFDGGAGIISKADETKRDKTLNFDEEKRLLAVLDNPRRRHLLPLILTAIDTAMRRGELFKLQWKDVDLVNGLILIQATNTKTQTERIVGLTPRVLASLKTIYELAPDKKNGLVFGITNTIKNGWKSACSDAGIEGLQFHDLRHTAITRMVGGGLPMSEIMKASGHTQITTFQRYVNPTVETAILNAQRLANYNLSQMCEFELLGEENSSFQN